MRAGPSGRSWVRRADAVVHLAFTRPPGASDALAQRGYLAERANVDMAYVVYQLALEEGVRWWWPAPTTPPTSTRAPCARGRST